MMIGKIIKMAGRLLLLMEAAAFTGLAALSIN
jgi:hypothetical protein